MHLQAEAEAATDSAVDVESVTSTLTTKQLRREVRAAVRAPHVARGGVVGSGDAETSGAEFAEVPTTTTTMGDRFGEGRRAQRSAEAVATASVGTTEAVQPSDAVRRPRPRPRTAAASPRTADSRARSARPASAAPTSTKQVRPRSYQRPSSPASQVPPDFHAPGARTSRLSRSPPSPTTVGQVTMGQVRVCWQRGAHRQACLLQGGRAGMLDLKRCVRLCRHIRIGGKFVQPPPPTAANASARKRAHRLGHDGADSPPEPLLERSCEGGLASTSPSVERSAASSSADHAAWQTQYCKFSDAEYTRLAVAFGMISKLAPHSPVRPNSGGVRFSPKAARPASARPLSNLQ